MAAPRMGGQGFAPDLAPNHPMALGGGGHTRMSPTVDTDTLVRVGWQGPLQAPAAPRSPHDSRPRPQRRARQRPERGGHTEWGAQTQGERAATGPPEVLKGRGDSQAASPQKNRGSHTGVPPKRAPFWGGPPKQPAGPQPPSSPSPRLRPRPPPPQALPAPPRVPLRHPHRYLPCRARRGPHIAARSAHRDTDQTKGAAILAPGGSGVAPPTSSAHRRRHRTCAARRGDCACVDAGRGSGSRGTALCSAPPPFPAPQLRRHDSAGMAGGGML